MNPGEWITTAVTEYSKTVIVVLLVLTATVGYGATMVEESSSTEQFESDTPEAQALDYVEGNFSQGSSNTTTVQVIVRNEDGNVLSRASLLRSLRYQQRIRGDDRIGPTLTEDNAVIGVSNIVATTAIRVDQFENLSTEARQLQRRNASLTERREELQADRRELQERSRELNATVERLSAALNETRRLQAGYDRLNASLSAGEIGNDTYRQRAAGIESELASVRENATAGLDDESAATFTRAAGQARALQHRLFVLNASLERGEITREAYRSEAREVQSSFGEVYRLGTRGALADEFEALQADGADLQERGEALRADGEALQEDFEALQERQGELTGAGQPSLEAQIDQLESMNDSEVREVVTAVLSEEGPASLFGDAAGPGGQGGANASAGNGGFGGESAELAFRLMPNDYEPGSPTATARTSIVRQVTDAGVVQGPGGPGDDIVDAQLAMEDLAPSEGGEEYLVFGFGKISDEISRSQSESFTLVSPFALLFVLIALVVAYRDPLDIVLGFVGIFAVLAWAFGAMGWAGIQFNQIMVAVPVLLIGLSIDYAIHIFMRHREQRMETGEGPRGSMTVALAGVGGALVWVTATTVIGFLSNLISPLPPIQDFGVVSSVGIVAALVVFGALIPAMKVEVDALLESWGLDRKKRAFGTGGGVLERGLSVGAVAARKAPAVVILLALVVTAAGAAGGAQVDTSFSQEDFLAEDPPAWMDNLPEQIRPGEYSAKQDLGYVNENFQREDSQVQVLVRGEVATPQAMERLATARDRAAGSPVTFVLSNGQASIDSPLDTMRAVAATNESFNATFRASDTDGDGVPDRNVGEVFDALFAAAPDRAGSVIQRADGEYVAMRMVVATEGSASTADVTDEARGFADELEGQDGDDDGLTAQATGSQVVNEVVQRDLFDSVIQSLIISIVAVVVFLMIAYRITEGSATLGLVTLTPVILSVAWILGTMFVLGVPFNVLTGTITSLTIGLGVAYSIHISDRYRLELDRQGNVQEAMETAVTGTGGALLGSAATTVGGFGTLVIAILPPLQQFGLITGVTIVYAFLASVLVLPSLLTVWTRYAGPDVDPAPGGTTSGPDSGPGPAAESDVLGGDGEDSTADTGATATDPAGAGATDDAPRQSDDDAGAIAGADGDGDAGDGPAPVAEDGPDPAAGVSEADPTPDDGAAGAEAVEPEDASAAESVDAEGTDAESSANVEGADAEGADAGSAVDAEGSAGAEEPTAETGAAEDAADADPPDPFGGKAETVPDAPEDGVAPPEDDLATGDAPAGADGEGTEAGDAVGAEDGPGSDDGIDAGEAAGAAAGAAGAAALSGAGSDDEEGPSRVVEPDPPVPGDGVRVTLEARAPAGRTMLVESLPTPEAGVESVAPDPVSYARVGEEVYALWDLDAEATLTVEYVFPVPGDAASGAEYAFEGRVETTGGVTEVGGTERVRVVSELEARAMDGRELSPADLQLAGRRAADGTLPRDRLEWLYRRWLGGQGRPPSGPVEFDPPGDRAGPNGDDPEGGAGESGEAGPVDRSGGRHGSPEGDGD